MFSEIAKLSLKSIVFIDFNCVIDTDIGLARLVENEYFDKRVFNEDFFKQKKRKIIYDLYSRKVKNPLKVFSNPSIPDSELDSYYIEFFKTKKEDILNLSLATDIKSLIDLFLELDTITIHIFCKDKLEKEYLENRIFKNQKNNSNININLYSDNISFNNFTQFYFKYIEDSKNFVNKYAYKTYYFSTTGLNFDEEDLIDSPIINSIIFNRSELEIIDLYDRNLINDK